VGSRRAGDGITISTSDGMSQGLRLVIISVALMQLAPVLNKFAVETVEPYAAAVINTALICLMAGVARIVRPIAGSTVVRRRGLLVLLACADAAGVLLLYLSLDLVSPVMFAFLGRLYVVFAVLLGVTILGERLGRLEVALVAASIVGSFVFSFGGVADVSALGVVFVVAYTFAFAFSNLLAKVAVISSSPLTVILYNKAIGLVVLTAGGLASGRLTAIDKGDGGGRLTRALLLLGAAAVLSNGIGLILFYESLRYLDFHFVNIVRSVGPILGAACAWPWFRVDFSRLNWVGAALLLGSAAVLAASHDGQRSPRAPVEPDAAS